MSIFDKGFFTVAGCAGLMILAAVPLVLHRVPRNRICGFRNRAALADDAAWYEANAYFGRRLIAASLCSVLAAALLRMLQPFSPSAFLPASVLLLVLPGLFAAVATARHVRSFGRR